jgi:hypothetical protein
MLSWNYAKLANKMGAVREIVTKSENTDNAQLYLQAASKLQHWPRRRIACPKGGGGVSRALRITLIIQSTP